MLHFLNRKRPIVYFSVAVAAIILTAVILFALNNKPTTKIPRGNSESARITFLSQKKLHVDGEAVEIKKITIPSNASGEYGEYVRLQKEQGMPLELFLGSDGVRYTYKIINRPGILAELIVCDGRIAALELLDIKENKLIKI